jgi:hypothetical protein
MMAVYVDYLIDYGWRLGPSCHLTADSVGELNAFAVKIGMRKSWLQYSNQEMPHYDLVASKRAAAVRNGAIELTWKQAGERYRQYREGKKSKKVYNLGVWKMKISLQIRKRS